MLEPFIQPWSGYAVRHIPESATDVFDFRYAARAADNRWNTQGNPTLYLASEKDVALAEWARHLNVDRSVSLINAQRRRVFRLQVRLDFCLNLCNREVWQVWSLNNAPDSFKDKKYSRAIADFIRQTTRVQGIIVPSVAFLDDLSKWCLVIFLEKLVENPRHFLLEAEEDGFFGLG